MQRNDHHRRLSALQWILDGTECHVQSSTGDEIWYGKFDPQNLFIVNTSPLTKNRFNDCHEIICTLGIIFKLKLFKFRIRPWNGLKCHIQSKFSSNSSDNNRSWLNHAEPWYRTGNRTEHKPFRRICAVRFCTNISPHSECSQTLVHPPFLLTNLAVVVRNVAGQPFFCNVLSDLRLMCVIFVADVIFIHWKLLHWPVRKFLSRYAACSPSSYKFTHSRVSAMHSSVPWSSAAAKPARSVRQVYLISIWFEVDARIGSSELLQYLPINSDFSWTLFRTSTNAWFSLGSKSNE